MTLVRGNRSAKPRGVILRVGMDYPDGGGRGPTLPDEYRSMFLSQVEVVTIAPTTQRRNSPLVLVAVLGMVMVGVLLIAILGKVTSGGLSTVVEGVPLAVGEEPGRPRADAHTLSDIAANPLLAVKTPPPAVACTLPDLGRTSAQLEAYYRAGIACLDQAWSPVVKGAGMTFRPPGLNVEDNPRTKCGFAPGEDDATAFYCGRDKIIYMPRDRLIRDAGHEAAYHLAVLAHEYGHHVQALSGILGAADGYESRAAEEEVLELSRRAELQANCFAGVFLAAASGHGAINARLARASVDSFEDTSGVTTHGKRKTQLKWAVAGFDGKAPGSCNTWSAPPSEVE